MTTPRAPLTPRQKEVLEAIERAIFEEGRPPTVRALTKTMGFASENGVTDHLVALSRKGYIIRHSGARGIELAGVRDNAEERILLARAVRCAPIEAVRAALEAMTRAHEEAKRSNSGAKSQ